MRKEKQETRKPGKEFLSFAFPSCLRAFVPSCEKKKACNVMARGIFQAGWCWHAGLFSHEGTKGKKLRTILVSWFPGFLLFFLLLSTAIAAPTDTQVAARASALEVAGGFANIGFKIRDGHAFLNLEAGFPQYIQVNLYSGNQYWFIAAAGGSTRQLAVAVYDEKGKPIPTELYENKNKHQAAAGFSPTASGPYIICIREKDLLTEGPATICLLYCFK